MQTGCDHYSSGGGSDLPTVEGVDLDQCKAHCLATESCTGIYFIGQSCYPYTSVCTDDLCQGCSDGNTYVYESSSAEGKRSTNKECQTVKLYHHVEAGVHGQSLLQGQ